MENEMRLFAGSLPSPLPENFGVASRYNRQVKGEKRYNPQ
jgi:hypothetical protein